MSETIERYQQLLDEANTLLWEGKPSTAAERCRQAIELRPDDPTAWMHLGYALFEANRLDESLDAYIRAETLRPGDVPALTKIAEIQAALGRTSQAVQTFLKLADRYMELRQPAQAVRTWQLVLRYDPDNERALRNLAEAYRRGNRPNLAARALVTLAKHFIEGSYTEQALEVLEEALTLAPENDEARHLLAKLRGEESDATEEASDIDHLPSPTEEAAQRALERMAEAFFEQAEKGQGENLTLELKRAKAIDLQTRGLLREALQLYTEILEESEPEPELLYNIGILHLELLHYNEAIEFLTQASHTPEYAVPANIALGQAYQRMGKYTEARDHYMKAVKLVDLQAVGREQADEMIQLYEGLAESAEAIGDRAEAEKITRALSEFLSQKGWEDKLREVRLRLGDLMGEDVAINAILDNERSSQVVDAINKIEQYAQEGRLRAALDEYYFALSVAPYSLLLHMQIADVLLKAGRIEQGIAKLLTIAEVQIVQGNPRQAMKTLERVLEYAPLATSVRSDLIDLQVSHGEIDAALENYLALADAYYNLAQGDLAVDRLQEALRIAPRGSDPVAWQKRIYRKIAHIHSQRLNWAKAAAALEALIEVDPSDAEAATELADLYYRLGHEEHARTVIRDVTGMLRREGKTETAMLIWERTLQQRPEDIELRIAMGEELLAAGKTEEAAKVWEESLEPLVKAGQRAKAAALLRRMIGLKTKDEQRYRKMLAALMRQMRHRK
nr:tetratricopeptide repeat protein [Ardenticatena sp.]